MGVFGSDGSLVGKVINEPNLRRGYEPAARTEQGECGGKKTKSSGTISWDARDPRFLILTNIPKSDSDPER